MEEDCLKRRRLKEEEAGWMPERRREVGGVDWIEDARIGVGDGKG